VVTVGTYNMRDFVARFHELEYMLKLTPHLAVRNLIHHSRRRIRADSLHATVLHKTLTFCEDRRISPLRLINSTESRWFRLLVRN